MFPNVRAVAHDTVKAIFKAAFAFQIIVQIGFIAYLSYSAFANFTSQNWLWIPKAILLLVSLAYFVFYLAVEKDGLTKEEKKKKKQVHLWKKRFFFVASTCIIKPATILSSVYTLYLQGDDASMMTLLVTCVMILGWVVSVILEICKAIIAARVALFEDALEADLEPFKNVAQVPKLIMHKLSGRPMEEKKAPSKTRLHLARLVETMKKDHAERKERKKAEKAKVKAEKAEQKQKEKESLPQK